MPGYIWLAAIKAKRPSLLQRRFRWEAMRFKAGVMGVRAADRINDSRRALDNAEDVVTSRPYSHLQDHPSVGPGKPFTQTQKRNILEENMQRNGGEIRSDLSGQPLVRAEQHKKDVTPPQNEAHIDHIDERSTGATNSYGNARVLSREENLSRPGRR